MPFYKQQGIDSVSREAAEAKAVTARWQLHSEHIRADRADFVHNVINQEARVNLDPAIRNRSVFNHRLLEIEAEMKAKEQAKKKPEQISPECFGLLQFAEKQIEVRLADKVPKDWTGWISYLRNKQAMVILRGRSFKDGGMFGTFKAGADVPFGLDTITEYQRGFDVSPPQDLDHLLINFGLDDDRFRIFLWYGENISPYKLIFAADVDDDPHNELSDAVVEACIWILKRPKHQTLPAFLKSQEKS